MKVSELITRLQTMNPEARVFMGYDGNYAVTEPYKVVSIPMEDDIPVCWWEVKIGDVVILCDE